MFDIKNVPSQKGKIAIVTGANTGIGFETTLALAKKEINVIMACRNFEKATIAKNRILTEVPTAQLEIILLDLSDLKSVRKFAEDFLNQYSTLDLLINNAGIMIPPFSRTIDSFESQMGANYFGHFLLTGLLLKTITNTPNSRIVSLSSIAHKQGKIDFDNLNAEKSYSKMGIYSQSKLACLMFGYELQEKLKGTSTISVIAHPGVSNTDLLRHIPKFLYYLFYPLLPIITQKPAKAALPSLMSALDTTIQNGDYIGPNGFNEMKGEPTKVKAFPQAHDKKVRQKLWKVSEELTGFSY